MEIHELEFRYVFRVANDGKSVKAFTECKYGKDYDGKPYLAYLPEHVHAGLVKSKLMQHLNKEDEDD